ncbi:hypothetical protein KBD45_08585 [Candidatus Dojkabacteria bacterium]|nr:hypothetical protein [Candidatus Dojkabacteria bacterium]
MIESEKVVNAISLKSFYSSQIDVMQAGAMAALKNNLIKMVFLHNFLLVTILIRIAETCQNSQTSFCRWLIKMVITFGFLIIAFLIAWFSAPNAKTLNKITLPLPLSVILENTILTVMLKLKYINELSTILSQMLLR